MVNINDFIMGPYDSINVLSNSQFAAFYFNKEGRNYISTSSKIYGPYSYDFVAGAVSKNEVGICYQGKDGWYVLIDQSKIN
jgi:hypothetical protein